MACELGDYQTRTLARAMFASDLELGELREDAGAALRGWVSSATARGDARMAAIVARLDRQSFERTWSALLHVLDASGRRATLAWLQAEPS